MGSEDVYQPSGATWAADEDQPLTGLAKGTNIRVRFLALSNEGTGPSGTVAYQLEVAETAACGSGSYSAVPGTASPGDHWEIVDSGYITDGESTFNIDPGLTDPLTGNFTNGELRDDNSNTTGPIDLVQAILPRSSLPSRRPNLLQAVVITVFDYMTPRVAHLWIPTPCMHKCSWTMVSLVTENRSLYLPRAWGQVARRTSLTSRCLSASQTPT